MPNHVKQALPDSRNGSAGDYVFEADEPIQGRVADLDRARATAQENRHDGELTANLSNSPAPRPAGLKAARFSSSEQEARSI